MAAIVTDTTDAQYVDPHFGVKGGVLTSTQTHQANGVDFTNRNGMRLTILTVNAISDADTLATGIEDIKAVAFQANDVDAHHTTAYLTTQAGGTVTFDTSGGTDEGWLWVLHGGPGAAT